MDLASPITSAVPSAHGPVLAVLARTDTPLTGRSIAELTRPGVSRSQTAKVLHDLVDAGLVRATPAGSAVLYQFNRDHLLAAAITELASARGRLWARVREHVATTWTHAPVALVVFGSAARGDGGNASDIDLLAVRPDSVHEDEPAWVEDMTSLSRTVTTWTGNTVDLLSYSPSELDALATSGERLLANIRADGLFLIGTRSSIPLPRTVE